MAQHRSSVKPPSKAYLSDRIYLIHVETENGVLWFTEQRVVLSDCAHFGHAFLVVKLLHGS